MSYDLFTYPHKAGFKDNSTSREAAEAIEASGRAPDLRTRVASFFIVGRTATADEVAVAIGETIYAIRPRVSELYKMDLIERTGERRPSANGQASHVYRRKVSA